MSLKEQDETQRCAGFGTSVFFKRENEKPENVKKEDRVIFSFTVV